MSDLMLTAVLSMPYDMAMADDLSRRQFYDRAQQALEVIERLTAERDEARAERDALAKDAERIDWLESMINEYGEIHLHDGEHPHGTGLGLRPGFAVRTLREAIDEAIEFQAEEQ